MFSNILCLRFRSIEGRFLSFVLFSFFPFVERPSFFTNRRNDPPKLCFLSNIHCHCVKPTAKVNQLFKKPKNKSPPKSLSDLKYSGDYKLY